MESSHSTTAWQRLVLASLCLAIFLMCWHTYDEPFERDLNIYADLYDQNYETFEHFEIFHLAARRGSDLARRQGRP